MDKGEAIIIVQGLLSEIKTLRQTNHEMCLRLSMFDDIMSALHGSPAMKTETSRFPCPINEAKAFLDKLKKSE